MTSITCRNLLCFVFGSRESRPDVFYHNIVLCSFFIWLLRHEFLCRDQVQLPVVMILVVTTFSSLQVFVSLPQFHVATWFSFPLLSSVSRPSFHVATQFLLPANLILGHNFPFMLRHHLFVFCLHSGCDSKLQIYLVPCRDM